MTFIQVSRTPDSSFHPPTTTTTSTFFSTAISTSSSSSSTHSSFHTMSPFRRTPPTNATYIPPPRAVSSLRKAVSRTFAGIRLYRKPHPVHTPAPAHPHTPLLPMELWGVIIKHACLAHHDPLNTSHELSFLEDSSSLLLTYRVAIKDKLACSLVSRQWNAYARELLYEFVWISSASQAKSLAHLLILQSLSDDTHSASEVLSYGRYIRRLHIETPVLELCAPLDLRSILENAPNLSIYSDHHSIQRPSASDNYNRCSSEAILELVAQPERRIRRLSWTCYMGCDAPLQPRLIPLWTNLAANLEFLELNGHGDSLHVVSSPSHSPSSTTTATVHLPALRALRMSLDDDALSLLSSWSMPSLTHLSILSPDFTNPGPGFAAFFQSHGHNLIQLELGHKPDSTQEHYITLPPSARSHPTHPPSSPLHHSTSSTSSSTSTSPQPIQTNLPHLTPNLLEFICSADAEWHWHTPDWSPRHCLLPTHPNVELVAIKGVDVRLREDPDLLGGEAYFMLFEQLGSFLAESESSFSSSSSSSSTSYSSYSESLAAGSQPTSSSSSYPNLKFLRDMSPTTHTTHHSHYPLHPTPQPPKSDRVTQFWLRLARRCQERGVWLEDWRGVNVGVASLLRAALVES